MKVNLGPTLKGECTVGVKLEDFVNARTNHYESVIEYDGVAVIAPVRELAHSPLSPPCSGHDTAAARLRQASCC